MARDSRSECTQVSTMLTSWVTHIGKDRGPVHRSNVQGVELLYVNETPEPS